MSSEEINSAFISRAQGCLLGQLAGDSLGSLVEFQQQEEICLAYPDGIRELADSDVWGTIAGQPTDDSEMALALARMLVRQGTYSRQQARRSYVDWLLSNPFDCGFTIHQGLDQSGDSRDWSSQANGALMRISPLGIFGANHQRDQVIQWAIEDATITHPHAVCQHLNAIYAGGIAFAVRTGCSPDELYREMLGIAVQVGVDDSVNELLHDAATESDDPPIADFHSSMGWVLIAFFNAVYQLLHAPDVEEGVVDTVMRGGDTDTNGAIAGALLGAVHGRDAIPAQWRNAILACRPEEGNPSVHQPRPQCYWPTDCLELAERLVRGKAK